MATKRYIWCETGNHLIRTDDGSYCDHFWAKYDNPIRSKGVESVTVIFRGPDGKVSIPWSHDAPTPPGYAREEVRGSRALRRLEKELDAKDIARHKRFVENRERLYAPERAQRREDLKQIIREGVTVHEGRTIHVTEMGREIARQALARSERGPSDRYEPGNHRRD